MEVEFKFIGLPFQAEVHYDSEENYVEFLSLTCEGKDASFLALSDLQVELEEAAYNAFDKLYRRRKNG